MLLGGQRREVAALAARERAARARVIRARARFVPVKRAFLGNPVNLLLPFTLGVLGGALALHHRPASAREDDDARRHQRRDGGVRDSEGISLRSLIATASLLWKVSSDVRADLRASRHPAPPA